jgi:hypothetical protein
MHNLIQLDREAEVKDICRTYVSLFTTYIQLYKQHRELLPRIKELHDELLTISPIFKPILDYELFKQSQDVLESCISNPLASSNVREIKNVRQKLSDYLHLSSICERQLEFTFMHPL